MSKTIIITGAAGYVGGHTALAFKQAGWNVIGIDRQITIPAALEFLDEFLCMDFVDTVDFCAPLREASVIVHCAGTNLVGPSIKNPGEYYNNNTGKTNRMLHWLGTKNWQGTVIFSSSAAVYGNCANSPIGESSIFNSMPVSPYGWSKLMIERILSDHCRAKGFKGLSLRYFNAAGCDPESKMGLAQDGTHLFTRVVDSVFTGNDLVINGNDYDTRDGTCIRDYIHVTDLAAAHLVAVDLADSMISGEHRSYNLGTGQGFTNMEVIEQVEQYAGVKLNWRYGPRRQGDPDKLYADPRKFMQDTAWMPQHSSIAEIASTTYKWFKKTYYNN